MSWKKILPEGIKTNNLSLDDCRNFKNFHDLMEDITNNIKGPAGFRIFHQFLHHLLFYAVCCISESTFPTLNKCWDELSPLFLTDEYDCEWLVYCWIFCDFPLHPEKKDVLLDHFNTFMLDNLDLPDDYKNHLSQFYLIMKSSRLGLYQEILSTSKVTKYKELFTGNVISTVRSIPYYESGEIFLTRVVSYLGDSFAIHDSKSYPSEYKDAIIDMVRNKMHYISETKNEKIDYECFMKLAGPYWMSCTHKEDQSILLPDEYQYYH